MFKTQLSTLTTLVKLPECLVLPVHTQSKLGPQGAKLDTLLHGQINQVLKQKLYAPSLNTLFHIPLNEGPIKLVILMGVEEVSRTNDDSFCRFVKQAMGAVKELGVQSVGLVLEDYILGHRDAAWKVKKGAETALNATYGFYTFKEKPKNFHFKTLHLLVNQPTLYPEELKQGLALYEGMSLMRDLGHTPPNICNPDYMAATAKDLSQLSKKFSCEILDQAQMKKLKMGGILAVTQGSRENPCLIVLEYKGAPKTEKPIVLVGKGVCFDSGGLSLKSQPAMVGMKFDMCGAASLLGTAKTIALLDLPLNVVFIIPAVTNMPDQNSYKPDDVIKTMSGLCIEITNTDAEGRMILCDALTYSKRFEPRYVVDVATLTGAVIMALGHYRSGLFANNDELAEELTKAAIESADPTWRLPMDPAYHEPLKSGIADMINAGESMAARSSTAACFLSRFTEDLQWAHLDIAGIAIPEKKLEYLSGRPVPLLVEFLTRQVSRKGTKMKKS